MFNKPERNNEFLKNIFVKKGSSSVPLETKDILYIKSESPYVAIHLEGESFLHNATLKSMIKLLDPKQFVRVHKTCIINTSHIENFSSRNNGDYDVLMKNEQRVRVSRNYAEAFKEAIG